MIGYRYARPGELCECMKRRNKACGKPAVVVRCMVENGESYTKAFCREHWKEAARAEGGNNV
jgi:hypothetical protein